MVKFYDYLLGNKQIFNRQEVPRVQYSSEFSEPRVIFSPSTSLIYALLCVGVVIAKALLL